MKTRAEMILELTKYELECIAETSVDVEDAVQFFADGGFHKKTDKELLQAWQFRFTDNYPVGVAA